MDAGVALSPLTIAYQTYGALNAAKSNAILVCHALTGDQHVANRASGHRQARLVETMVGPGQADRHRSLFRHLLECGRRLHGHDRARPRSIRRPAALRPRSAGRDDPRHGARPGHADRPSRHRHAVLRRRRLDGRHAGAAMGGDLSGARLLAPCRSRRPRKHSSQNIAFHEVGRQAVMADPDWRGGRYLETGRQPDQGPRRRPHGRAHHLSVGRSPAAQIRPQAAGSRSADLLLRRRFPDRELSAPSGLELRRAVRRQFLSLRDAGLRLFRSRRRLRRLARARLQGHQDALLRRLLHFGLAVSDRRRRAPSCMR